MHLCYDNQLCSLRGTGRRAESSFGKQGVTSLSQEIGRRPRILSGMRPTGKLHLGNLVGALQNWVKLQDEYESYHFVADWHMLTTGYDNTLSLHQDTWEMVADWLACGLDPGQGHLFHSVAPARTCRIAPAVLDGHAARLAGARPTYKEQLENIKDHDINTYGFLGYPLLQAADILIYKANAVPVGEDQVPHVELTREVARRFNQAFGRLEVKKRSAAEWKAFGEGRKDLTPPPQTNPEQFWLDRYYRASLDERADLLNRESEASRLFSPSRPRC